MEDTISRKMAIDSICRTVCDNPEICESPCDEIKVLETMPSAQPETHKERTETHACDCISRNAAIRWVKTECNPYGKPTLDFESGKKVIEHLKQMPSAQADLSEYSDKLWKAAYERGRTEALDEIVRCKDCKYWREGTVYSYCDKLFGMGVLDAYDYMTDEDDYCSMAERRTDESG